MISTPQHLHSVIDQDGAVILDVPRNQMTTLNSTGAFIWQRLERGVAVDQITAELARDTGVDETIISMDLKTFLEQLKSQNLLASS